MAMVVDLLSYALDCVAWLLRQTFGLKLAGNWKLRGSRTLLVVAHPDDESMFFTPTLLALKNSQCTVSVICLSTGRQVNVRLLYCLSKSSD